MSPAALNIRSGRYLRVASQLNGPTLRTYSVGTTISITAVRFAHRSRRFTIRTPSQTQKAAKATPKIVRAMAMPQFYPRWRGDRKGEPGRAFPRSYLACGD